MDFYFMEIGYYRSDDLKCKLRGIATSSSITVIAKTKEEAKDKIIRAIRQKNIESKNRFLKRDNLYEDYWTVILPQSEIMKSDYMIFNSREDWSNLYHNRLN